MLSRKLADVMGPYLNVISVTARMVFNVFWIHICFPEIDIYIRLLQSSEAVGMCL